MLVYQVNDTDKVKAPVGWLEMTVAMFQRLYSVDREDPVAVFAAVTGTKYVAIAESQSELVEAGIYQVASFTINEPQLFRKAPIPDQLKIQDVVIKLPKDLERLSIAQNLILRRRMAEARDKKLPLETLISTAVAIAIQPLFDLAPFSAKRADELEKDILEMKIEEVFGYGFFYLRKLNDSGRAGLRSWFLALTIWTQKKKLWLRGHASKSWTSSQTSQLLKASPRPSASSPGWSSRSPSTRLCPSSFFGPSAHTFRPVLI